MGDALMTPAILKQIIQTNVEQALAEDIGTGDLTAQLIHDSQQTAQATVIVREPAVLAGIAWFNEVFHQIDPDTQIQWHYHDGDNIEANQTLVHLEGRARALLTGERCALNFLQTLSGTATLSRYYARKVAHLPVKILDTRKTIPGLRLAQKYAVQCGGCTNHRMGLYDAFLIKENHIVACGSVCEAIQRARHIAPHKQVEVEVENLEQLQEAIDAKAEIIMLDNFDLETLRQAVKINLGQSKLEVSGNVDENNLLAIAETGVDFISLGALTKHLHAIDLSMRFYGV